MDMIASSKPNRLFTLSLLSKRIVKVLRISKNLIKLERLAALDSKMEDTANAFGQNDGRSIHKGVGILRALKAQLPVPESVECWDPVVYLPQSQYEENCIFQINTIQF